MRKKFLTALVLAFLATPLMAQSFVEDFPSGTLPTSGDQSAGLTISLPSGNWFAINLSNPLGVLGVFQGNSGVFSSQAGAADAYMAMNFNAGSGTSVINLFMMSPTLTFNNGDTISFFTRTVDIPGFPDRLNLKLSLNGSSTNSADFTTNLVTVNPGLTLAGYPSVWTQFSATLSGLGGPTSGRFAFQYDVPNGGPSGANSDYIGVDTVSYIAVPEPTTWALMGLMAVSGGLVWRRRQRAALAMANISMRQAKRIA